MQYIDRYGLIHAKKGEFSENGPLFAAEYWICRKMLNPMESSTTPARILRSVIKNTGEVWFDPNPSDQNDPHCHFSHDNMTGIYALSVAYKPDELDNLPVSKWNHRSWLHPRDLMYYNLMKDKNQLFLLSLPILLVMALVSCVKPRGKTSGKCLWFLRLLTMKLHKNLIIKLFGTISFKIISFVLKKEHGKKPFVDVFKIYFPEIEHPIHEMVERMYNEGKI